MDDAPAIAPRHRDDLAACVAALRESHAVDRYPMCWPDDPITWLSPPATLGAWIATRSGSVVGHVVLTGHDHGVGEISRLFVTPQTQGAGLAVALLDTATEHANSVGRRVELNVVEESAAAIRLYERLGWTLIGRAPAPFIWPDGSRPVERRYAAPDDG